MHDSFGNLVRKIIRYLIVNKIKDEDLFLMDIPTPN